MFFIGIFKIIRSKKDSLLKKPVNRFEVFLSRLLTIPAVILYVLITVYAIGLVIALQYGIFLFKYILLFLLISVITFGINAFFKYIFTRYLPKKRGWRYLS
jgi:ABC-type polysaccharide/polyol phosphate export permease